MNIDYNEFLEHILTNVKRIPNYIYGKQLLIELYETFFKIHNHMTATNPISSVLFHTADQYLENSLFENYVRIFILREIHNKLGLSLDEFLSRSKYEIETILTIVNDIDKKKLKVSEKAFDELQESNKSLKSDLDIN